MSLTSAAGLFTPAGLMPTPGIFPAAIALVTRCVVRDPDPSA